MKNKTSIIFVLILLFGLSASAFAADTQSAGSADVRAGIVLGNFPDGADVPTNTQTARCLKAFELYKSGAVNKLLVTGGFTRDFISEARMMKIALVTYGVPPEDIAEEELSNSTIENGLFSSRMFEQLGWEKKALLISQKIHLIRANQIFKNNGFKVKNEPAAEFAEHAQDFALIPDMSAGEAENAAPADMIIVYEPFDSLEPMSWPTPQLARRLRAAAALYNKKTAPQIILYSDWYARGPIDLAQMMKVAIISLGVPSNDVTAVPKIHYGKLPDLVQLYADKSAVVLTTGKISKSIKPETAPHWKFYFLD